MEQNMHAKVTRLAQRNKTNVNEEQSCVLWETKIYRLWNKTCLQKETRLARRNKNIGIVGQNMTSNGTKVA
jgi:hypothetical protein